MNTPLLPRSAMFRSLSSLLFLALVSSAQAQLTWDPALDSGATGGAGSWDNATANWWNGASDVAWVNSDDAVFGGTGDIVTISTGSSITVNNLTLNTGVGKYTLRAQTDNEGISVDPGAIWAINDNELEFTGDQTNDTKLSMTSAGTLTVTGSGTFDTGEKQNGANWVAAGSTLDVQGSLTLRGHTATVGQFSTVKLADGTTYIHERNAGQTYANAWELSGSVNFDNRFNQNMLISGIISDGTTPGRIVASNWNTRILRLINTANTFSGGITVDSSINRTELLNVNGDGAFGAVPGAPVADYILLKDYGELKMNNVTINANRGITLENGGIIVNTGNPNSYGGKITGTGPFQIGRAAGADGNAFILTSATSDYSGDTNIYQGRLTLGADQALPSDTFVRIGGKGTSRLIVNGMTQTIAGLGTAGNNNRHVINSETAGPATGTLTLDVPVDVTRVYGSAFGINEADHQGNLNVIKIGEGSQQLANVRISGSASVTEGQLEIGNSDGTISSIGSASVSGNSTLILSDDLTIAAGLVVNDGGALEVLVDETNSSLNVTTATIGPDGTAEITLDYAVLTSGNPTYPGIVVSTLDGFDPSSSDITINVAGSGLEVGTIQLIDYSATSALADIANFNLVGLPSGVAAVLVNNTVDQSIDLDITEAVQALTWSGDTTIDGTGDWEIGTLSNWNTNGSVYTDDYPSLGGTGDIVNFTDAVTDLAGTDAAVNLTTTVMPTSVIVNNTAATANYTFSGTGKITGTASLTKSGTGSLTIANSGGNDYSGGTFLATGDIILGINDALPTAGVLTIGTTGGVSRLLLQGYDQTVGGLENLGNNTRQILNTTDAGAPVGTPPTLTVNVPALGDFVMGSAVGLDASTDQGNFNLTKSGDGNQALGQLQIGGDLSVTGGTLLVGNITLIASAGDATVNTGGNLVATGLGLDLTSLTVDAGGEAGILWNVSDWAGAGGIDWPRLNTSGDFTVTDDASFTVVIDDELITGFTEANTSFTIGTVGGTMSATDAKFTVDQSGFTAGSGTFTVTVVGSDIILNYTVGGADAYSTWAAGFPGLTGGFDGDHDLDGLSNGEEWYFFNSNPTVANGSSAPITALTYIGGNSFTFTHLRPVDRTGVTENYEWTTDLASSWTASGASNGSITVDLTVGAPTPDVAGYESVTVTVTPTPATATELFGRLRVTLP